MIQKVADPSKLSLPDLFHCYPVKDLREAKLYFEASDRLNF